ncbi:MAG: YceI family protein [Acidobacteriota bacterium]
MQTAKVRNDKQTVWAIDPAHSTIEFSVKNYFFFLLKGRLNEFAGRIVLDEADTRAYSVEVAIQAASIDTGAKSRDTHLRSAFLETERYPHIRFQSTEIEPGRDRDTLRLTGLLTIKGKSREVILDVDKVDYSRSPNGEEVRYYSTSTKLDRLDFGMGYRLGPIGRSVKVMINVQANRLDS